MRVLTFGTFDHFHPGHRAYLEQAAKRGDLFVIVARDTSVQHIKGRISSQNETERLAGVRIAFPHATVLLGDPEDYLRPVRELKPDLILLGYDQKLPPGVSEEDLPCPVERAQPFAPETYKSSILKDAKND